MQNLISFNRGSLSSKKTSNGRNEGRQTGGKVFGAVHDSKQAMKGTYKPVTEDGKLTVCATGAHLKPYNKFGLPPSLHEEYSYVSEVQVDQLFAFC